MNSIPFPLSTAREYVARVRRDAPLVHCMTNDVVQDISANVLLALGAAPAMITDREEAGEFAKIASAVLINLGTLTRSQVEAMRAAIDSANAANVPWILDPVAVGSLSLRTAFAKEAMMMRPAAIRGNASEILALAGAVSSGRGVESGDASENAVNSAMKLSALTGAIVAVTGVCDYVTDGEKVYAVTGGDEMMTRVTGVGCALSAMVAAFCGVVEVLPDAAQSSSNFCDAVASACAAMSFAGERVARDTREEGKGVGTFRVKLLDELDGLGI